MKKIVDIPQMIVAVLSAALLTSGAASATECDPEGSVLKVLSYNIHGLFPLVAKDDPRDRMPTIGWLAGRYDVVMFQEDFEYHRVRRQSISH